ncbi:dihydrofolate reductase family protein [Carnobacterium gallinarum]|uniref:dihydrofolate reductase family protein n=1 Tax=Carnobacterium gallinarum TaxID=2749 RepID=UPI000550C0A8|nr:dihydrofolate reductase [Carnobacterium gallinarum]
MSREIILYIAVSLDGYIAASDGNIDFLNNIEVTEEDTSYQDLLDKIDTVIMGRTTYDQVTIELSPDKYFYEEQMSYIITNRLDENSDKLVFTNENPVDLVNKLKKEEGRAIWIIGGGSIISPLVEANLIDTYIITTIPTILGKGIPLFPEFSGPVELKVNEVYQKNGIIYSIYSKK